MTEREVQIEGRSCLFNAAFARPAKQSCNAHHLLAIHESIKPNLQRGLARLRTPRLAPVFAFCFSIASFICAFAYAGDVELPKQRFETLEEYAKYREAARAHFQQRCMRDAREKIYRSVNEVQGLLIKHPRRAPSDFDLADRYWMGDPYGLIMHPPVEISRYLRDLDGNDIPTKRRTSRPGFEFVETPSKEGSGFIVHRLSADGETILAEISAAQRSRYAVLREDVSTNEDRQFWVAGGRLAIVDLTTGEVLGERIGYVFEAGFGSTSGARRPWLFAQRNACPPISRNAAIDRVFVEKVLRPAAGGTRGR
jgi:hypothetical protein